MSAKLRTLTDQQRVFVDEYLVDLNITQAATRAGYSNPSYCRRLIHEPHMKAAILEAMDRRSDRVGVDADRVFRELSMVGLASIADVCEWDEHGVHFISSADLSRDQAASVKKVKSKRRVVTDPAGNKTETVELELEMHSKLDALKEMGKHLGIASKVDLRISLIERLAALPPEELADLENMTDAEITAYLKPGDG